MYGDVRGFVVDGQSPIGMLGKEFRPMVGLCCPTPVPSKKGRPQHAQGDDSSLVSERGFESRVRLFYENSKRKMLEVGVVSREVCFATTQGDHM
jgi:hypothetical protein